MVEKAPVVILKGCKKKESEEILKKLTDNGATLTFK
jgi:ribosomal protein L7/L12